VVGGGELTTVTTYFFAYSFYRAIFKASYDPALCNAEPCLLWYPVCIGALPWLSSLVQVARFGVEEGRLRG